MPLDKFSHDEVIIFGHQRLKDQIFLLIFSTFIEFRLSQTAMTGNVNKLITALLL